MIDPETQVRFNTNKGSAPIRLDIDPARMDACAQIAIKALSNPTQQIPVQDLLIRSRGDWWAGGFGVSVLDGSDDDGRPVC